MHIIRNLTNLPPAFIRGAVATIGNFDGVHLGHQRLIARTVDHARAVGLPSAVITFDPHPLQVMLGDSAPPLLMPLSRKLACLENLGVDLALVLPFTRETAGTSPEDFAETVLVKGLAVQMLFVGYDYAFGKGRRGNAELLAKLGEEWAGRETESGIAQGFAVEQIAPVFAEGGIVSSTRIREEVLAGNVDEAALLLGRPHSVEGDVAHGNKRGGALLGFPTANLHIAENLLLPKVGVYAVLVELPASGPGKDATTGSAAASGGLVPPPSNAVFQGHACGLPTGASILKGVASVGKNPTFGDAVLRVETHILDFNQDIYGAPLRVYFVHRLRDERKFNGIDALKEQIGRDAAQARDILP